MQKTFSLSEVETDFKKHKNTQSPSCQSDDIITSHVASGKLHWTLMGVKKDRRPLHTIMKIV